MGQATNLALRERILELRQQGATIKSISEQLSIPFSTTKNLCRRFREKDAAGLSPDYFNCGSKTATRFADPKGQALKQREQHPNWGAPRIRVEMQLSPVGQMGSGCPLPSIRTLQKWYRASGLYKPRRQGAGPAIGRSTAPHNIWEVDAKENITLADGSPACYLTIGDEKTGAWLEAVVFPLQEDKPSAAQGSPASPVRHIRAAQQAGQLPGGQRGAFWLAIERHAAAPVALAHLPRHRRDMEQAPLPPDERRRGTPAGHFQQVGRNPWLPFT